jgi:hypothetical protein
MAAIGKVNRGLFAAASNLMTTRVRAYLFGLIPWGVRTMTFERVDQRRREIQTRERDFFVRRWDHLIRVEPLEGGRCRYTDDIEIRAGMLTFGVWLFAMWFYRHRQKRWQQVAQRLAGLSELPGAMLGLA